MTECLLSPEQAGQVHSDKDFFEFSGNDKVFVDKIWGHVDTKNKTQSRSKIVFSESRLTDYVDKIITRNAIDRFSAGTKEGALYSEKTFYNGKCTLNIDIKNNIDSIDRCMKILAAEICDLDRGYLSIGGLTSIGRGLFSVERVTINNDDVTVAMKNADIQGMIGGKA